MAAAKPSPPALAALRSLAIDRATADVMAAFRSAHVEAVLLKGPSVALWLYPGGAGRPYVDSDILVRPSDVIAAGAVLTALGFKDLLAGAAADEEDQDASPWRRETDGVAVDLHHGLRGVEAEDQLAWEILAERTEPMTVAGVEVSVLEPVARAMNLVLHAAHDGVANPQCLMDLERAVTVLPGNTWPEAATLAARLKALSSFAIGLRLIPAGGPIIDRLGIATAASVEIRLRVMSPPPLAIGLAKLQQLRGVRARARFIARNVFPTPAYMRFWCRFADRRPIGLVLAYPWRWASLLWHFMPAYRAWRRTSAEQERA